MNIDALADGGKPPAKASILLGLGLWRPPDTKGRKA
jgi:hypothetical protein